MSQAIEETPGISGIAQAFPEKIIQNLKSSNSGKQQNNSNKDLIKTTIFVKIKLSRVEQDE